MTELRHARNTGHHVADAHGRTIDLTVNRPTINSCPCTHPVARAAIREQPRGAAVVRVTAILTGGLVMTVLLVVIRDVVTTVASTSVIGLVLRALVTLLSPRER
ncbi:hypothetical protein OOK36_55855 [Streptomyces sp. NBC_00365]|uniref:hypothetical protein n=1 Tax=Streptomyces sp. NBC_00365 TaxID=2975726 RepID=UPI00224E0C2F|nr:hypothetical protein [Streptomyces sp. NBC_00365]MCX5097733.1 hypothetical protein [Streptomyces sp. NBC_00365]